MAAVSIPMLMLAGPGAGWFLGHLADRRFGCQPVGILAGIALGLLAAVLRIRVILRRL